MTIAPDDAWVYARRSRKSDDQASVNAQIERALDEIREHGWRHAGTLNEEISASRYARKARDAWGDLLDIVRAGKAGIIVLWESDRGDRTLTSWSAFLDLCRETGTRIYITGTGRLYDLASHADWKTLATDGVDNDHFSRKLSGNVKRGKGYAMRHGRPAGQTPYGYKVQYNVDTSKIAGWAIIPDRAAIVREIIRRVGKAEPVNTVKEDLDKRGIPGPTGGMWNTRSVRHIARNPAYAGLVALPDGTYAERQVQEDGAEWPPLVERGEWEKAKAVLDARARGPMSRPGGVKHLMTNLADCDCGGVLTSQGAGMYACRTGHMSVRGWWLDEVVSLNVKEWLRKPEARRALVVDTGPRVAVLRSEVAELEERRKKYVRRAAEGDEDADEILAELRPKIAAKKRELDEVTVVPAVRELIQAGDRIDQVWEDMTVQARRAAIAAVTGITVSRVPKGSTRDVRDDIDRVVFDWRPQGKRKGPGGRLHPAGKLATS